MEFCFPIVRFALALNEKSPVGTLDAHIWRILNLIFAMVSKLLNRSHVERENEAALLFLQTQEQPFCFHSNIQLHSIFLRLFLFRQPDGFAPAGSLLDFNTLRYEVRLSFRLL
jgi:hypothetical protein